MKDSNRLLMVVCFLFLCLSGINALIVGETIEALPNSGALRLAFFFSCLSMLASGSLMVLAVTRVLHPATSDRP